MPKVNKYFNNKVVSIQFQTDTLPATVGVMEVGDYEFATSEFETMTVISGELAVLLPGSEQWKTYEKGGRFTVEANQTFEVQAKVETAYLCTYGAE